MPNTSLKLTEDYWILGLVVLFWIVFSIVEALGVTPRFVHWHTISFFSSKHLWLKILLTVVLTSTGPLFWWHASQTVPK